MAEDVNDGAAPAREGDRATRKKRARRKQYTSEIYSARLAHEDARVVDDYARRKGLDRSDVVRLGMHQFALRQQMRYQPKSALEEMQEQVFREYFAEFGGRLDALASALQELPRTLVELQARTIFPAGSDKAEVDESAGLTGEEIPRQRRALEQALFASVLTLRLVTNYLVEPQLRRLDAPSGEDFEPHLRAATEGKEAWSTVLGAVMKLTGERVMGELGFAPVAQSTGTNGADGNGAKGGAHAAQSSISDADLSAVL